MDHRQWAGTTYGNARMHTMLIGVLRHMDVRFLYVFTAALIVPVCLIRNSSRGIIYRYLRQRHAMPPLKAAWMTYINHWIFSQAVIDKFAMYAGRRFKTTVVGGKNYRELEIQEPGFIQFSSHVGNYEIAGYSLVAKDKPFNALVYGGEKATVMTERVKILGRDNIKLIPLMPDMSHVFAINEALAKNEVVSMPGDRTAGSTRAVEVTLLGAKARLPLGPFQMTASRQLDALAVNVVKTSAMGYTVYATHLHYDKLAPRKERTEQLAQAYASELERIVKLYPAQWYNFYEFWN